MAITIEDQPYSWSARGQKLMIVASSTNTAQDGFQYGLVIDNTTTGQSFNFYIPPAIDGRLYFDIQSLVQIRNAEAATMHSHMISDEWNETGALNEFAFNISEYWIVAGVLTQNAGSIEYGTNVAIVNGYYQVSDGYKPNSNSGAQKVKYALTNNTSLTMSDRLPSTFVNKIISGWGADNIFIPVREEDWGMMFIPGNDNWLASNDVLQYRIILYDAIFDSHIGSYLTINSANDITGLPLYPANINSDNTYDIKPSDFPGWKYYRVNIKGSGLAQKSISYFFINACEFNLCDCIFENVRLGWVNSRSGWDYFNFSKRSEVTNEIDRKVYRRNLFNNTPTIFNSYDRGLYQRENMVQRVMTINSNYLQQGEFILLRGLLVSNQVHWIQDDGTFIPVNIDDTSYTEKNTADGKLYNLTLKVRIANEYWT